MLVCFELSNIKLEYRKNFEKLKLLRNGIGYIKTFNQWDECSIEYIVPDIEPLTLEDFK